MSYNNTDTTFNDFGNEVAIPAITILDAQGREFWPSATSPPRTRPAHSTSTKAFQHRYLRAVRQPDHGQHRADEVGRNGYGGDLIIGGKNGDKGIEVFKVKVEGVGNDDPSQDVAKPSNLGTLASNGGALEEVCITTAPEFVDGDTSPA